MSRDPLGIEDFKLRLFVDTNVLVDYFERSSRGGCFDFLEIFNASNQNNIRNKNIEIVTSDYVLWEFYHRLKKEFCVKHLFSRGNIGIISASSSVERNKFNKFEASDMRRFGNKIKKVINDIENNKKILHIEKLIGKEFQGFSDTITRIMQCSKFPYKDAIVLVSSYFTNANVLVTCDNDFNPNDFKDIRDALNDEPINMNNIEIKKPKDLDTKQKVKQFYAKWFVQRNNSKIVGSVSKYCSRLNVLEIICNSGNRLDENAGVWLVKFVNNEMRKYYFRIPTHSSGNFRKLKEREFSIKMPIGFPSKRTRWNESMVFVAS